MSTDTLEKTVSPDITKAELTLALSKEGLAYQTLLQECEDVVFNRDNLNDERTALVNLRKVKSKLAAAENPYTEKWAAWNSARKSLVDPVAALLLKKESEYKKIATEIAQEEFKATQEKIMAANIKSLIDNFFIEQSQAIAAAAEPSELVRIEKLIGSHKANSSRYAEFLPLMAAKAANLTDLIKQQKIALKELEGLKSAENAANEIGDDQAVLDSREAQEQITAKISENREVVQSEAISMATNSTVTEVEVITPVAPKPRRQSWKWRVCNLQTTAKKMPHWVVLTINEPLVEEYLKAKKAEGIDGELFEFAGIEFYLEKTY